MGGEIKQYGIKPNSKTAQYLKNAKDNNIKDTFGWFQNDQSLSSDDNTTKRFITEDYKPSEAYKALILFLLTIIKILKVCQRLCPTPNC